MLVPFNEMPSQSRIWIYQASRPFNENSKKLISERLTSFTDQWESHGHPLKASWKTAYDLFLIVAVDETYYPASGCSVDKVVHLIKELESELGLELLNKTSLAVREGDELKIFNLKDLKQAVFEGKIKPDSIIFNNLVPTLGELNDNWEISADKSWVSRYFNK